MEKATDGIEKNPENSEGTCIIRETVFVNSDVSDEQIFENLNIKVEPVFVRSEEDLQEIKSVNCEQDKVVNHDNRKKKKKKKKGMVVKKKKIPRDRVAAMREKIKLAAKSNRRKSSGDYSSENSKQNESGSSPKTEVVETPEERRRRLARERMRRKRTNMSEKERVMAMKKQRIQKQKLRLIQRLKETEEETEARRREYREQKRRSRQRLRELSESSRDDDSKRYLKTFTTSDGDVIYESLLERERRLARERQRKNRYRRAEEYSEWNGIGNSDETEEEKELKLLKYELQKQQSRQRMEDMIELDGDMETERRSGVTQHDMDVACKKKRAPDDIEYLYFYENSEARRKRLIGDKHKAKYRARKRMVLEDLDIEEECDVTTSRRYLDFD